MVFQIIRKYRHKLSTSSDTVAIWNKIMYNRHTLYFKI